jgi:hypothetical protein
LKTLLSQRPELVAVFESWLAVFQPVFWEEVRRMVNQEQDELGIDYQRVLKFLDSNKVIEGLGVDEVLNVLRRNRLLEQLVSRLTPEEREQLLRSHDNPVPPTT